MIQGNLIQPPVEADRDSWRTPDKLWRLLDDEFLFDVDVAADDDNHKCAQYFTRQDNGLMQPWAPGVVWCNPPFSDIAPWAEKAAREALRGATVVMILPGHRHEQEWWHRWVIGRAAEVRCLRGRVQYVPPPGFSHSTVSFPSVIVVYPPNYTGDTRIISWP